MDDNSNESLDLEEANACHACLGNDRWEEDEAWIGCSNSRCPLWFHKECISDDVVSMTPAQLGAVPILLQNV